MRQMHQVLRSTHTKKTRTTVSDPKWKTVSASSLCSNQSRFVSIAHCLVDKMAGDSSCGLFAIFDGHGGRQVSDHCAERFPVEMRKELQKNPADLVQPITNVFQKVSQHLSF